MRFFGIAAALIAAAVVAISGAAAQEKVVSERALTDQTGWWEYYNVTPDQLSGYVDQNKARIISLAVNNVSPLRLSATMVANSGPYASGWWWYYGLTADQLTQKLNENKARLIDIEPYKAGGSLRFAVLMVPNTGANAVGWWWYYGLTPDQLNAKLDANKARLVDVKRYVDGGERFAAIMVSNEGPKATAWWWYYGKTADQLNQLVDQNHARLLDVDTYGSGANRRFTAILVPNTGSSAVGWWWYYGLSNQDLLETARRHGARLFDMEPPQDGASGYAGIMIDNGMTRNGDCGGAFAAGEQKIVDWMKTYDVPGASAAIVKGDKLVYSCAFGYADLATGRTVKPADLFRIASITKPITSSAIRKLEADSVLSRMDKMLDRMGSFKPAEPYKDNRLKDITIQNLLDHKGGWNIGALGFDPMFYTDTISTALHVPRPSTCPQNIQYMFQNIKLSFPPGGPGIDKKDYSNFGYCILGRIVQAQSGQTYENYVKQNILAPIHITDMKMGKSLRSGRFANEVQYYDVLFAGDVNSVFDGDPKKVQSPDGGFYLEAMDSHGGWLASAMDIARFGRFANPAPYGGGDWSFQGGLPGTSTIVERNGDVVTTIFFNHQNRAPGDAGAALAKLAADVRTSVTSWPTNDLWGKYGYQTVKLNPAIKPARRIRPKRSTNPG
ncbi:MAG TPA: serine hydrolase [Parvularculaceae bacterium]|nr:serine hydrolase [Parvularculaceae bacterium]